MIGNGTGDWDIPVGGMGALTGALEAAARRAGAELRTGAEVVSVDADAGPDEARVETTTGETFVARHVLANVAPAVLARLLGDRPPQPAPEGSQLKLNMVLRRLPRLRDSAVPPEDAFAGTFHVNESYSQLQAAYAEAAAGRIPSTGPCRGLLPLAHRPVDPLRRAGRSGRSDADRVRAAHAGAGVHESDGEGRGCRRRPCGR